MFWILRCQNVTTDQSGKVGFYVPLNLPKDIVLLSLKVPSLSFQNLNVLSVWRSCNILQAKSLGKGADDNSGMIHPESSHEVMILHINKTFGLDLLEIDSKTELPCNQVNGKWPRDKLLKETTFQEFKATALLTSNTAKMVTLHYTILAKVRKLLKQMISKFKGSVISTQRMEVSLGKTNSMASWKRSGLIELDPKGKGDKGYDGITVI